MPLGSILEGSSMPLASQMVPQRGKQRCRIAMAKA
jgi:hypothetical protein